MPGTSFEPPSGETGPYLIPVAVVRLEEAAGGETRWFQLPNIRITEDQQRTGAQPHMAGYEYTFTDDQRIWPGPLTPHRFHEVIGLDPISKYAAHVDDRIMFLAFMPDGSIQCLDDGFAQLAQANVGDNQELVSFRALGVPHREFDTPIMDCWIRDGQDLEFVPPSSGPQPHNYQHDLRIRGIGVRFNPEGRPNKTPALSEFEGTSCDHEWMNGRRTPIFVDPLIIRDPDKREWWNLYDAVRYVLQVGNGVESNEKWTAMPSFDELDKILFNIAPTEDGVPINYLDESTYTVDPIRIGDIDIQGDPWPVALMKLLGPWGFDAVWQIEPNVTPHGKPRHYLKIFRRDGSGPGASQVVWGMMQVPGEKFDPTLTNINALDLARDMSQTVNSFGIITETEHVELSIVLAPAFRPDPDDVGMNNRKIFDSHHPHHHEGDNYIKYRWFVAGEAGDPYYQWDGAAEGGAGEWVFSNEPLDLREAFQGPLEGEGGIEEDEERLYTWRRRPASHQLVTTTEEGKDIEAKVYVSTDYDITKEGFMPPCIYPHTQDNAHWQLVGGNIRLFQDRLGIQFVNQEPWNVTIRKPAENPKDYPFPFGNMDIIKCMARPRPAPSKTRITWFRLECRIPTDRLGGERAKRRPFSPTKFEVTRWEEMRDRYSFESQHESSEFAEPTAPGRRKYIRDDSEEVRSHAQALRAANEHATIAGSVQIPWIHMGYMPGTRFAGVVGRFFSTNGLVGAAQGQMARYSYIAGIDRRFHGGWSTTLLLEDDRTPPARPIHHNLAATARRALHAGDPRPDPFVAADEGGGEGE